MSEERYKILDKAKKLKELADRGIDGEMTNAKDMLEKYMKKHNITMDEISSHNYSSNTAYSKMSDEQFLKEMLADALAVGIGLIFTSIFNKSKFDSVSQKSLNELNQKYGKELQHRANKKK
jgi:hypothetical protein